MSKYIYNILVSLLFFSACSVEDTLGDYTINGGDESSVAVVFSVDVPSVSVSTKASVPIADDGISSLKLATFDGSGNLLEVVAAKSAGTTGRYMASISKETRKIHFVANYDADLSGAAGDYFYTAATQEYLFWREMSFNGEPASDLGLGTSSLELYRNWSKVVVDLDEKAKSSLKEVSFYLYNKSTYATLGTEAIGTINVPASNGHVSPKEEPTSSFVGVGEADYAFENSNQGDNPTFVIVKGKFNNSQSFSYYKVDLSGTVTTGESSVYDIIRNYQYNITIKDVTRVGVSWDEIIVPGRVADYNIITSMELIKYPSISFEDAALSVSKTTYIFVNKGGSQLNATATYREISGSTSTVKNRELKLGTSDEKLYDIVNGSISLNKSNGVITASIKGAGNAEQRAAFYVMAGKLQRKIDLILRPAYKFTRFEANPSIIEGGIGSSTVLTFATEEVDESAYPFEVKIKTNYLYAVDDGVRIETTGNGEYYYVYVVKSYQESYSLNFKTNADVFEETPEISADLFDSKTCTVKAVAPKETKVSGVMTWNIGNNSSVKTFNIDNVYISWKTEHANGAVQLEGGTYEFVVDGELNSDDEITFSYNTGTVYDNGSVTFEYKGKLSNVQGKTIHLMPIRIVGTLKYNNNNVPKDTKVEALNDNKSYGSVIVDENGHYQYDLPASVTLGKKVKFKAANIGGKSYISDEVPLIRWINGGKDGLNMTMSR